MLNNTIKSIIIICFFIIQFLTISICDSINYDGIVNFNIRTDRQGYRPGEKLELIYDLTIAGDYHIYSVHPNKAPIGGETYVEFYDSLLFKNVLDLNEPVPITKFDKNFNQVTSYHRKEFQLTQLIELNDNVSEKLYTIEGTLFATACIPSQCVRIIEDFKERRYYKKPSEEKREK